MLRSILVAIAAALVVVSPGPLGPKLATAAELTSVRIAPPAVPSAISGRVAAILAGRIEEYSGAAVVTSGDAALSIYLEISPDIGSEGFRITDRPGGGITIAGNDDRGLLYGVGKFLHTSTYSSTGITPSPWRGVSVPSKPLRGMYLATHFRNFYESAPIEDVKRYVEDLSMWGINSYLVWFGIDAYNGIDDPEAQKMLTRLRALLQTMKDLGLATSLGCVANDGYKNSPVELRAVVGPLYCIGTELCVSKPGVIDLELQYCREKFDAFKSIGLDYWFIAPYDNGGCYCSSCAPWGINGYLRAAEPEARAFKQAFLGGKVILSLWYFDKWFPGEWAGITDRFNAQKPDWVDYIMADDYGGVFPPYPLEHGSPGGLPMVNFPEISMYAHYPWGGYGAIPLPQYLQRLWDSSQHMLSGGFPYSEGIFEDINKTMVAQLYWEPDKPTAQTVREYISFWFSPLVVDSVSTVMATLESNLPRHRDDSGGVTRFIMTSTEGAEEAFRLAEEAASKLPSRVRASWRWRIVYLRALIDSELATHGFRVTSKCAAAFDELTQIYAAQNCADPVRPPYNLSGVIYDKPAPSAMNGLLVRTWGRVVSVSADASGFSIQDGSGKPLRVELSGLSTPISDVPQVGQYVAVTGVVSNQSSDPYNPGTSVQPRGDDDITTLAE